MRRRILLADDSVTIQKVIELTFLDEDYEVRAVSNGDEAVAALGQVDPDFVIADVHMPGANGYEVCRRSKQQRPGVPVLLLVGTFEPFDEGQARSAGADSFLKKPFDSQELLQRVEELLAASAPAAPAAATALPLSAAEPTPMFSEPPPAFSALDAELPPLGGYDEPAADFQPAGPGLSEFSAEPSWGNFELEAEPEAPPAFTAPAAEEPYDREPSFSLEPEPSFSLQPEEPVFTMDDDVSTFTLRDDEPVSAPDELGLGEPNDPFASPPTERMPVVPQPAPFSAGFSWSEPAVEEALAPAPAAPPAWELPAPEPVAAAPEPWSPAPMPEPEPEPWSPPPVAPPVVAAPVVAAAAVMAEVPSSPVSAPAASSNGGGRLGDEDVDRIARRVVELLGDRAVRDIAWEVIPDLAEVIIRDRLRELESQVDLQ
ncbi:MAG TPA: response regulator [Thermoanaerobaculia bacterium]|nr:response regulator [Thermoanaerobaculia bacterium]